MSRETPFALPGSDSAMAPLAAAVRRVRGEVILLGGVLVVAVVYWRLGWPLGVDSAVYREGADAVLHGRALYEALSTLPPWVPELRFTYPPAAALVFTPLTLMPTQLSWGLLAVLSVLALGVLVRIWWGNGLVLIGALAAEPVYLSIGLGQVNILLMALVLVDALLLRGSRAGGMLVGLAAAVKLTPLIFVLYLLLVGRWRDALRAAGTFGAVTAVGAVVQPRDSVHFWTATLLDGNNATANSWYGNQSLNGLLQRFTGEAGGTFAVVVLVALAVLAWCALAVRSLHARNEDLAALIVTALCGVLVSPISWTHHWVWVVPAFALLATRLRRAGERVALAALASIYCGWTFYLVPKGEHAELAWTPLQALPGNAYVLAALSLLALLLRLGRRRRTTGRRRTGPPPVPAAAR